MLLQTMKSDCGDQFDRQRDLVELWEKIRVLLGTMQPHQAVSTKARLSSKMDESSSSSSSAFPPPAAPPPQSSSSSSTSSAATAAATSSITPMAASSSTPSGGGGGVIMAVPYALSPQPSASSPHTPTSTPSSSSSNSAVQSAAGPSGRAAPTRNKRQELSFAERIDVIMARKSGKSMRQLAVQFGCGKTQILNILGQREAYLREWDEKQAESNPHISSRKRRSRRTGNEETNRLVWEWYTAQREQGIRVTGPMLQREARSIARGLGISNFAASNGWLDSFRRLHNIGPQSRALQQQQQQQQQQQSRIAQTSGQLYAPFGNSGSIQNHPQQHPQDPSIPTISAAYSLDPDTYGHHHQSTDAVSPAASSSTGSSSHLGHHPHGVLPPPPPLEAFGSDVYHQPEYYVEEDEEDEAEYYRRREYQSPEVPRMHPQQQHQHITSTVSLDDCRTSTSGFLGSESSAFSPYRSISSQSTDICWDDPDGFRYNQFTELYPSSMMQQPQQQQQQQQNHHQQQPGVQQVSGLSPRLLIHQGSINERVHHDERSNLLAIGQPMVHHQQQQQQHQVHQPMVRRSVLVSTRAAAAALESQLHNQQQQHDAVQQSADPPADEKRRRFAAASSSESSSSGLELLSASSGAFGQLTSMARQRNLAYFQYADDHGDVWLEIRPPPTSSFRVPLYGYRTHLMRLLVDRHLTYWLEAIGHCVRNGTLRSPSASNELSTNQIEQVLDLLAGGAVVCQGRGSVLKRVHQFHPKAAIEQGIAGSNYFTLPDYRYRAYDCARLVDARSGSNQCAACLRPPEPPPPPPLEVISPPGPQVTDSPMDAVQEQEERGESKRPSDAEPLNLSVHPPVMGVLRFPSPQAFSNFAPAFESGALLRGGADQARGGTAESNVDDYRLAQEAAYLSIHAHPRERSVSAEGCEWTATAPIRASSAGSNGGDYQQRRARSDSPIQQQHHLEAGSGDSKGASPAFDPEFHTTWVKQETIDSPQSNGS